jgi:hypothetical protein
MDPTVRLAHLSDGLKSAVERVRRWDSMTEEQRGFHREQMKFLVRQFVIVEREIEMFIASASK